MDRMERGYRKELEILYISQKATREKEDWYRYDGEYHMQYGYQYGKQYTSSQHAQFKYVPPVVREDPKKKKDEKKKGFDPYGDGADNK